MPQKDPQEVLSEEILGDARRRADREIARARTEAEKLVANAKAAAQAEMDKVLEAARARAEARRGMILRTVAQEVARGKLRARDGVLQRVLEQAGTRLQDLSGEQYRRSVISLALEAVRQMPADSFVLKVSVPPGGALDANALASEIKERLRADGRADSLSVELVPHASRGVVIESADGRMRWDNSYDARLRRLRPDLRRFLFPMLFGET